MQSSMKAEDSWKYRLAEGLVREPRKDKVAEVTEAKEGNEFKRRVLLLC